MPVVKYGTREIYFSHIIDKSLKHAYITVDFYEGVILKSPPIDESRAKVMVYKKGKWILGKLKLVERIPQGEFQIYVNPDTPDQSASVSGALETFTRVAPTPMRSSSTLMQSNSPLP